MNPKSLLNAFGSLMIGCSLALAGTAQRAARSESAAGMFSEVPDIRLAAQADQEPGTAYTAEETRTETSTKSLQESNWDIWGPIELRSADPEALGVREAKNIIHYGTSSVGEDDTVEDEFEFEYGFAPNHELICAVPLELGDGAAEGNGDLEVGWHWRLWKEKDWLPAFALRNILYIPSGYHSSGLDWMLKGLLTKSIIPDKWRVHLNPFLLVASGGATETAPTGPTEPIFISGGEEGDLRDFQWGFIVGTDYKIADNLSLILDYIHRASGVRGWRNQHSMEAGLDWEITEHQGLGLATNWTVDGDHLGENWGFSVSYVYNFDVPAIGK